MNRDKISIFLASIGIILVSLFMVVSTYAYFTVNVESETSDINLITFNENTNVIFTDTSNVSLVNAYTGEEIIKTFNIENTSNYPIYYDIVFKNVVNNFENGDDLVYELSSDNNGAKRGVTIMPTEDDYIAHNILIEKNTKQTYTMKITFLKTDEDQSNNMEKTFSSNIEIKPSDGISVGQYLYKDNTIYRNMVLESKNEESNVLYTNSSTFGNTIYYFNGKDLNNHVIYNNFCFQIIRTDDDNNIRMIYDGMYDNGSCTEEKIIENSIFNSKTNYNAYVGYMYGNASSNNYEAEHNNLNSSTVKIRVENWFNDHFKEKKEISQSAIYCNSRKTTSFVLNGVLFGRLGFANNNTGYNNLNKDYTYQCYNQNDRFAVSNEKSNNASNASVGLITYDEYILSRNENEETFLDIKDEYWTMTPDYFDGRDAYIYSIKNGKILSSKVNKEVGIRPVITINNDIKYTSGDGSVDNPYIIGEN